MSETQDVAAAPMPTPAVWPSWLLLVATVLAGATMFLGLDNPFMRETGLPGTALMPIVAGAVVLRLRKRRSIGTIIPAVAAIGLTGILFFATFGVRLPDAKEVPVSGTLAADMTLPDHTGTPQTLSKLWAEGPLLLVFYRGHW